ncbi:MAG: hypothetical protein Q8P31_08500 [Bacillota bacterium]|nr:hypothetical protein [Bacillota bacterium]
MIKKLSDIDVRWLYLIMVIFAIYPLLRPIGLPLPITDRARNSFAAIDALRPGDLVFFGIDYSPTQEAEMWPQTLAIGHHLAQRGVKMVMLNMIEGAYRYEERIRDFILSEYPNYQYGVNIIALPFTAGREAAFNSIVADLKGLYQVDLAGAALNTLPLWNEITGAGDFDMYVELADAPDWWLRPMSQVPGLKLWNGTVASGASTMAPLYQSGQMVGFIYGMAGAAEYEALVKKPGSAAAAMDTQSMGHALIILFVILGNIGYIVQRNAEAKAKGRK